MRMPTETLERLSSRCKRVAALSMNLEQLRRESETTRRQWWSEIEDNRKEYSNLQYDPDEFLESNFAMARLKLVASFLENREPPPAEHGFRDTELEFIKEFEKYIVYDRLSVEEIRDFVRSGAEDEKGIVSLAKHAAVSGYDQVYKFMQQSDLPNDLALAFQRIYSDRIRKMESAAAELKLSEVHQDIEATKVELADTAMTGATGKQTRTVTTAEAKKLERSYIQQVEARLKHPGKDHPWKRVERFSNIKRIMSEVKAFKPFSAKTVKERMPHGLGVSAVILKGNILFKKPSLTLLVKVVGNYKEMHLRGFDAPVSYGELMRHVERSVFSSKGHPAMLALASPAGWDNESISYAREGKALMHDLSLVLLGLKDKVLYYNSSDERLKGVLPYLEIK